MTRSTAFALIVAAMAAAGVGSSGPMALAQEGHQMGPGMGSDKMGTDSEQGGGMMGGGMMGRGMGGMMGMMGGGCPMMGGGSMYPEGRIAFLKAELAIKDAGRAARSPRHRNGRPAAGLEGHQAGTRGSL